MPSGTKTDKKKKSPPPAPDPAPTPGKPTLGTAILAEQKEINARLKRIEDQLSSKATRPRAPVRKNIWGEVLPAADEEE